jgi:large subunit ribosomal protein L23
MCEVASVNTTVVKGKNKRFGRSLGRRSDFKKAYVALKACARFDLDFEGAAE